MTSSTSASLSVFSMFSFDPRDEDGVRSLYCQLATGSSEEAAAAVAHGIARRRIGVNSRLHEVWLNQLNAEYGATPSATDATVLIAGLLQNVGTPNNPANIDHLHGLVAEEIWLQLIAQRDDLGLGLPIHVEGHDWSVTDPGGDGLTVYCANGVCVFRLWESKFHGGDDAIRDTVNGACRQVKDRATSYLARFSLIAQRLTDDSVLANFYSRLPELWVDRDAAAGVGVVIAAAADPSASCFSAMPSYFGLSAERHQGQLNMIGDCDAFCERVREILWKGCGLWIAP